MKTMNLGLQIDQGADFNVIIRVDDMAGAVDLTGYSFLGEMKYSTDPTSAVIAEFDFTIQNQYYQMGQVLMSVPAATIEEIITSTSGPLQKNRRVTPYVFDVKMQDTSGKISRIIQGIAYVSPQATQENF